MTETCVFCGHTDDSFDPEHWVPQWLSRELIPKHASGVIHGLPGIPAWEARIFELTVPNVCEDCNHHWMSDIESQAKPHVLPFILGSWPDPLTTNCLTHLVRWCYLKIISLELGRPSDHVSTHPRATYEAFMKSRMPPYPNCSLAFGVRDIAEANPVFLWFGSQGQAISDPQSVRTFYGYRTTLLIGHLVIDAWGINDSERLDVDHGDGFEILWPVLRDGGTFTWPPKRRFTGVRLDDDGDSYLI